MQENTFCPGCGKNELKFEPRTEAYEHPCTLYENKSREYIIKTLKDKLTTAQLNIVLKYYNHKPREEEKKRRIYNPTDETVRPEPVRIGSPKDVMPEKAIEVAKLGTEPRYVTAENTTLGVVGGIGTYLYLYSTDGNIEVRIWMNKATFENFEKMMTEIAEIPEAKAIMEKYGLKVKTIKKE